MVTATGDRYTPPSEYRENTRDYLVDLNITDSTELWLMEFPTNLDMDFDKQEVTLNLHHEGKLGSVEGSSGKEYDLVSFSSQQPFATVFTSNSSESKIVGKISRRVNIVNYPETSELVNKKKKGMSLSTSSSATESGRTLTTPTIHSSKQKSALSQELGEFPKRQKNNSNHESGNFVSSSGSMGEFSSS